MSGEAVRSVVEMAGAMALVAAAFLIGPVLGLVILGLVLIAVANYAGARR